MAPGDIPTIEVTLDGPVELGRGLPLDALVAPDARETPVTATVEVRQPDGEASRATAESLGGASSVLVPLSGQEQHVSLGAGRGDSLSSQ